ncbi:MAG: glycosyltransferase family 8 protein [Eubacteriales bacterium]
MKEIPIFFSVDDGYAPYLAAALTSAIAHASENRVYRAIVLHGELSEENRSRLSSLATDNFKIDFAEMKDGLESITDRMSNRLRCDYFTLTIYYRLFIPTMFPQYDKAVYIDSDVILNADIAELFDTQIGECLIGACPDYSIQEVPPLVDYVENAVGVPRLEYINSGVLVMNLYELRKCRLDEHFLGLLNDYHFDCIAPDQDYLNAICNGRIFYLGEEWDAMPNDTKPPLAAPKLIHYNLFSKPWCYDGIQYGELFWKHAERSGFIDEIRAHKDAYSDEQKRSDSECMALLVTRGGEMPHKDVTFKKMYENGVKIRL